MTDQDALRTAREWLMTRWHVLDKEDVQDLATLIIRERAAAVEAAIQSVLPASFYAGLPAVDRLNMLVAQWQRAIRVSQELEAARPEIERKARVEALRWVTANVECFTDKVYRDEAIEAELARLQAGQEKERDATR